MNKWKSSPFSRFKAMPRLVDESELAELASEPGFDASMVRKLRRERRRVFRLYLAELVSEFKKVEREAMYRAANDPLVDPGFLGEVLKVKGSFWYSVTMMRIGMVFPAVWNAAIHRKTRRVVGTVQPLLSR